MQLKPTDVAPSFTATTWQGETFALDDLRGHPVWLAFFRYAACPLCALRVHDLVERHDALLARGLKVVGVFQSPLDKVQKFVNQGQVPPFTVLADPERKLYPTYGLRSTWTAYYNPGYLGRLRRSLKLGLFMEHSPDGDPYTVPADFLIDPDGTIADAYYGRLIADHIPFERVDAFLERLPQPVA